MSRQQELSSLKEHRDRAENQHQVELTALSTNLASVRNQLESSRKKLDVYKVKVRGLTEELEGKMKSFELFPWLCHVFISMSM